MTDYTKSKIYKITSPNCDKVYIGSTTKTLQQRFMSHRYNSSRTGINYNVSSRIVINSGEATIIEDFPCQSLRELHKREGEIMRNTLNRVNVVIPGR